MDVVMGLVIASAFGDAATKFIGFIVEVRPAIAALIIISAACALVFSRGHRAEILASAALALVLLMSFQAIGAMF